MERAALDLSVGFKLGDFQIIPSRNVVEKVEQSIRLEPKIMGVCLLLAKRCGDVVSRDDMIHEVWGSEIGSDESLTRAIHVLRKTFNQTPSGSVVIETFPKRGYRLVASIADLPAEMQKQIRPAPSEEKAETLLAVLPFDNLSTDKEMAFSPTAYQSKYCSVS